MPVLIATIIALISLLSTLNANEHYLLPDHKSDLTHTLKLKIARAESLTIITSELDNSALATSIEKALKRGMRFQLITTSFDSAAFYAKYRETLVKVPLSNRINESFFLNILLIDKSDVCFSSVAFSEKQMQNNIGEVICTTNQEDLMFAKKIEKSYVERFEDYNR
ncbi:MAG: hypothetical protein PF439_00325 [Helicobacteraceae bacterium]|nr:hypothetical protein [Helicobacteraceae bacterium]